MGKGRNEGTVMLFLPPYSIRSKPVERNTSSSLRMFAF